MSMPWITTTATATFLAFAAGGAAVAQSATEVAGSALDRMHGSSGAPAVSAAVRADGDIAWAEALGEASNRFSGSKAFPSNPAYKFAGGGILATPSDLARFGAAHLEPGFLSEDVLRQMMTSQTTTAGEETGVGLAWRVGEDGAGRRVWHHAGSQAGTRSLLMVWPDHGVTVAVCTNLSGTPPDIFAHGEAIATGFLR